MATCTKVENAAESLDGESTAGATACCLSCRLYRRATIVGRRTCDSVCGSRKAAKTPSLGGSAACFFASLPQVARSWINPAMRDQCRGGKSRAVIDKSLADGTEVLRAGSRVPSTRHGEAVSALSFSDYRKCRRFWNHAETGHRAALASALSFARRSSLRRDHASASSAVIGRLRTVRTALKFVARRKMTAIDRPTCDLARIIFSSPCNFRNA
jgi:hypothetical protein